MGKLIAFVGMIFAILGQTGNMVIAKVAMSDGINKYVMIFYTYALSSIFLFPVSFFLLHRSQCPPLTFSFLCKFFLLALFGWSSHTLSYVGIDLSSPTLATALLNLIPAFTFLLALIFRMEVLDFREHSSQAKLVGTIVSIGGAFIVIFYKGPSIFNTTHSSLSSIKINLSSPQSNWVLGGFYCAIDSLMTSLWYIYQASIIKKYPAVMVVVFFQIFFSTILSALFALFTVRDPNAWVLRLDMGLVSIFYQGVVAIAIRYSITTWCVDKAGPLFCTMFKPLGIIFTVIMASLFLGDHFHLGSLVGSVIIVVGFYGVMWGKAEEEKKVEGGIENYESSSCHSVPLLQHKV